jgi:hypothetical protein
LIIGDPPSYVEPRGSPRQLLQAERDFLSSLSGARAMIPNVSVSQKMGCEAGTLRAAKVNTLGLRR